MTSTTGIYYFVYGTVSVSVFTGTFVIVIDVTSFPFFVGYTCGAVYLLICPLDVGISVSNVIG
jgi:hypothetical protein